MEQAHRGLLRFYGMLGKIGKHVIQRVKAEWFGDFNIVTVLSLVSCFFGISFALFGLVWSGSFG